MPTAACANLTRGQEEKPLVCRTLVDAEDRDQRHEQGAAWPQPLASLFDGITRHSPEGGWFKQRAEEAGLHQAVKQRDFGEPIPGSKPPRNN